ncbi:MAG: pyridoxal-phosphate dependent enzyme, partial [Candidatus Omnitrophica bacterium]|nr:pyridoxal-phosphate dependent enzyme [Candidatus Omnitrophota bacterium]
GKRVDNPETIATAIRIGNPASWKQAEAARDESGGLIDMVSDEEILEAYQILASKEGIFVEPASAASIAGLLKLFEQGYFNEQRTTNNKQRPTRVVCILTGHGLKDPDRAIKVIKEPKVIPADLDAVVKEIGL